ncbi:MAG: hypothetical protein IJE15_00465 [Bacteroidaceae bacterium]|nr:hypothetical protein [Bacteroidaceae bacterium]
MKHISNPLARYLVTWLKIFVMLPLVVTVHLTRLVLGLYILAVHALFGMKAEADRDLDELLDIDL